jgi:hypothetical protein
MKLTGIKTLTAQKRVRKSVIDASPQNINFCSQEIKKPGHRSMTFTMSSSATRLSKKTLKPWALSLAPQSLRFFRSVAFRPTLADGLALSFLFFPAVLYI